MNKQIDILIRAMEKFQQATGLYLQVTETYESDFRDALIKLDWQKNDWLFDVEIKTSINSAVIGQIKQSFNKYENTPLLVTSYVTPVMAEQLRSLQINYLDTAGNVYICRPPLLIDIRGNKQTEFLGAPARMFRSSGLKIIFALLCNPGLEKSDYRTIASMADVALGSVNWVINDLKKEGYLLNLGKKGRKIIKKEELLKNWVSMYYNHLKPKIIIGHYASTESEWWKKATIQDGMLWGSEVAANVLTKYLKPEIYTIYINELRPEFLIRNKLHSTSSGDIEICKKFWHFDDRWADQNIVPPLLIYADLISSRENRNIETANIIYEKELASLIKQD